MFLTLVSRAHGSTSHGNLFGKVEFGAPTQRNWGLYPEICILTNVLGISDICASLRTAKLVGESEIPRSNMSSVSSQVSDQRKVIYFLRASPSLFVI